MIDRRLLLLMSLCLVGGASVTKIVQRRGVSSVHAQLHGATDQWDGSLERNGNTMTRLKELISPESIEEQITAHQSLGASAFKENFIGFNAKSPVQTHENSDDADVKLQAVDGSKDLLELKKSRNNTRRSDVFSKNGQTDKWIPMHHKAASGLHFNRTRFRNLSRSRMSLNWAIHTTAGTKVVTPDSPRKLNLTGSYGVLKLISKDNLVRIVNSQLQSVPGLIIPSKISHSRKRDLINMDHTQMDAVKMKKQELYNSDNQTLTNSSLNPDQTLHTLWRPHNGFNLDVGEGDRKTEIRGAAGTASWKYKHFTTRIASTPQSEVMPSTETNPLPGQTDAPTAFHMGISHTSSHMDSGHLSGDTLSSLTERTLEVKRELDQSAHVPFSVTQNPLIKIPEPVEGSHVLKLPPDPQWRRTGSEESGGMTVDSRPGKGGCGLVFQEMDENEDKEQNQQKPETLRSRRRRSWIWNQFFVIEEYAGPEPVLIGRLFLRVTSDCRRNQLLIPCAPSASGPRSCHESFWHRIAHLGSGRQKHRIAGTQLSPRAAGAESPGRGDRLRDVGLVLAAGQTDGRSVWSKVLPRKTVELILSEKQVCEPHSDLSSQGLSPISLKAFEGILALLHHATITSINDSSSFIKGLVKPCH
ncbi:putative cadherin-4 [Triplophysa rosa]|uniref:Cadherin-4 n=1 Tax=Triplophysa rosa TaxID=992332 RepID=A0A9W8C7I6_TRIRA|nr:putative cadherin-4 [Triplophysa rosa]